MTATPALVVVNPAAGGGAAMRVLPRVLRALQERDIEFHTVISDSPEHLMAVARDAGEDGAATVVVIGGDGSVGATGGAIAGTDTALTIVPVGTGNDFARSLGLSPRHALRALDGIEPSRIRLTDVGVCTTSAGTRRFLNVAGAGFDAAVNERANALQIGVSGTARYLLALGATLRRFQPLGFVIVTDGERLELPAMLVAVCNAPTYGGGMRVAPDARTDDGRFDVCIVESMPRRTFVASFPRVYRGTHVRHPKVRMLQAASLSIQASDKARIFVDGEDGGSLPATLRIEPGALRVTVPS